MWNPLAYLDYNNLWRTMDEMGKEVWHEELQLNVSAQLCLQEGQSEGGTRMQIGQAARASTNLVLARAASCHAFWYTLMVRAQAISGILASFSEGHAAEAVCRHTFISLCL